ncbi:hypothetical protein DPEC_G00199280 [Dallia pectoralis]|uniref:Uncharacterized protein n=1 Tax=Dallia pectoralis TaxID=75939 RepID=A0ACC2G8I9_DALPE|nr:hypothetical protein DPEC_G00199280 [Dallia pectoralis]
MRPSGLSLKKKNSGPAQAPARGRKSGPAGQRQRTETDINTTSRQRKDLTNPTYTRSERTTGQYLSDHKVGGSQVDLPALRVSFL